MQANDYQMFLVIRAIGRITQMVGRSGNDLIINRNDFFHEGRAVSVPTLSANSMRHAAVREPGGMWLIDAYDLSGLLIKEQLRLLVNGGNNACKSGGAESLPMLVEMRQLFPLLGLMGGGMPDSPKPGVLQLGDAVLVCNETRRYFSEVAADTLELPEWLRAARTCVGKWTNYRHDAAKGHPELLRNPGEITPVEKKNGKFTSSMPYGGEAIIPGAILVSEIRLSGATPLELGALLWSLRLWQRQGGIVGGMSSRGNGRTQSMLYFDGDADLDALADEYAAYALSVRDEAVAWLHKVYAPDDKSKGKGRGKKAKEPEPV